MGLNFNIPELSGLGSAEILRHITKWCDYQDEDFNDLFSPIQLMELYLACQHYGIEFADNLDWEDEDDEEHLLAKEVNRILGYEYYYV